MLIKAQGLKVSVGEACKIYGNPRNPLEAEVVGFQDGKTMLMASSEISAIRPGTRIFPIGKKISVRIGTDLIGRIVNDRGEPMDGKGPIRGLSFPLFSSAPPPMERHRINEPIDLGIRAINGLLTCGKGQRMGIMSGSGVGKSVLMGMIAKYTEADITVIALIGERGREVREFIEKDLGEKGWSDRLSWSLPPNSRPWPKSEPLLRPRRLPNISGSRAGMSCCLWIP